MPWSPTIEELVAAGVQGDAYAHELVTLPVGTIGRYLEGVDEVGRSAVRGAGPASCVGAFRIAMRNDTEAIVDMGDPRDGGVVALRAGVGRCRARDVAARLVALGADVQRTLLVDAPLSPMRIGRQPSVEDRRPLVGDRSVERATLADLLDGT